ncbi:NTP pyrophosphatase (non-canonical NTP hydrolase) [Nocardioides zeae]|uniref:NTP pyrophosphatase (Non-canonical NTP hydrolase) n=1 Tax=Nocardioides zeae TaxID=1457234 RepID=A0ACC6ICP8_9ACTN|nr:MazG nucleotide pyrophosphohydrolase domain-containing protein [Nocardioides zeae]MDR6175477.1 NTP pyrophosphatase (non-canonical NTP hydrolase) [Nocardioides zeae]MDR6208408.1 NTP pyrophosphatase (non-canonical NTP hydrolase) [Nocardioides zeae]
MKFSDYQRSIRDTDQRPGQNLEDITVHLLGLAGEAGSVAGAYKKYIRDGAADTTFKLRMREEIGDVLWYLAAITDHLELNLDEVAATNLEKTRGRWLLEEADAYDTEFPELERLPRHGTYEFIPGTNGEGRPTITVMFDGQALGAELTDNALVDDGYRFHDVFHLAYATVLGWSPVTRALMNRKRKSSPDIDESEDGGRAIVIEEGVAAFVFAYAARHEYLDGLNRVDQHFLDQILLMTHGLEVGSRKQADFERAILQGFNAFRELRANNGGFIDFDADARELKYRPRAAD